MAAPSFSFAAPGMYEVSFSSVLFTIPGKGGWTFAPVPEEHSPSVAGPWGRIPVDATVDGHPWKTSVWRERSGRVLLPVPKQIRGPKGHGDTVDIRLRFASL